MTRRSTHPHKIALKDSEGKSDLTTLAYGPGKAEDQNIHSATMLARKRQVMWMTEVTLLFKVTLAQLSYILKTKNTIKQQDIAYCISTSKPPSFFSSLCRLGVSLVLPCCLCWKVPTQKGTLCNLCNKSKPRK